MAGEGLFSPEGKCIMSFAKLAITLNEIEYRQEGGDNINMSVGSPTMP